MPWKWLRLFYICISLSFTSNSHSIIFLWLLPLFFYSVVGFLLILNSSINPFIYATVKRQFLVAFLKIILSKTQWQVQQIESRVFGSLNTVGVLHQITGFVYIRTDWPILSEKTPILLECSYLKYFTERSLEPELLNQEFNEQNNWNFASNWKPLDQTIDIADCCFLLNDKIKFNG